MKRLIGLLNLLRRDVLVLLFALINSRTPKGFRAAILASLLYLVSPVDIMPDAVPLAGVVDDMIIVPTVLTVIRNALPPEVVEAAEYKAGKYGKYIPILGIAATLLILLWTGIVIYGLYRLLFT